jgi:hypothetical protein
MLEIKEKIKGKEKGKNGMGFYLVAHLDAH